MRFKKKSKAPISSATWTPKVKWIKLIKFFQIKKGASGSSGQIRTKSCFDTSIYCIIHKEISGNIHGKVFKSIKQTLSQTNTLLLLLQRYKIPCWC